MEREWLHIERVLRACLPNAVILNKPTLTTIGFFLTFSKGVMVIFKRVFIFQQYRQKYLTRNDVISRLHWVEYE